MSMTMTIEVPVDFQLVGRCGRRGFRPEEDKPSLPPGRVPRASRLMALALRLEELVRTGRVRNYTQLASMGHALARFELDVFSDPCRL